MKVLGIETSCDETAVAIIEEKDGDFNILESLVSSQIDLHKKYGGVVPEVAARAHVETILPLLKEAHVKNDGSDIDVVAVTSRPGLLPSLRIGVEAAKTLAWGWKKPLVGVDHLEGHIYSVWLGEKQPEFPAVVLIVSGGHTELILMKGHGEYKLLGSTRDDAAGEAFDKVAKLLDLPYPGGPEISRLAVNGDATKVPFPRPMLESGDYDFSFSGLKTAVNVFLKEDQDQTSKEDIAASFQSAVVETLVTKTLRAVEEYLPKSVILTGGVSANKHLRDTLESALEGKTSFYKPDLSLTGDNAAMIAVAGYFRAKKKDFANPVDLKPSPQSNLV